MLRILLYSFIEYSGHCGKVTKSPSIVYKKLPLERINGALNPVQGFLKEVSWAGDIHPLEA